MYPNSGYRHRKLQNKKITTRKSQEWLEKNEYDENH